MSNFLHPKNLPLIEMENEESQTLGLNHLTVIPTNYPQNKNTSTESQTE